MLVDFGSGCEERDPAIPVVVTGPHVEHAAPAASEAVGVRIVSLVPSVTETLTSWGREPIACTRFCERPDLPHVGGTKDPDVAKIADLAPDLVIVDAEENRREDFDQLVARGISVHALHVQSLADVDVELSKLSARIDGSWMPLDLLSASRVRARAFVPIWRRPWIALGAPTYGTSLLEHLGVANVFSTAGKYPHVGLDEAVDAGPDVVLAPSEPYPFTVRQLDELQSVAPTTFVDGRDLFWWGARTPGALRRLAELFGGL
jgi:ABC-type hemin transport system substrate-binding protein